MRVATPHPRTYDNTGGSGCQGRRGRFQVAGGLRSAGILPRGDPFSECHRRDENLARGDAPCWHGAAPSGLGPPHLGHSPARRGESGWSVFRSAGIPPAWHPARMSAARRESRPGRCPVPVWRRPFGAGIDLTPGHSPPRRGESEWEIGARLTGGSTRAWPGVPPRTAECQCEARCCASQPPPSCLRVLAFPSPIPTGHDLPARRRACGKGPASAPREALGTRTPLLLDVAHDSRRRGEGMRQARRPQQPPKRPPSRAAPCASCAFCGQSAPRTRPHLYSIAPARARTGTKG